MKRLLFAVCATWWCACSPAMPMDDAGVPIPPVDAGTGTDAGHQHDAGAPDAGEVDAGHLHPDAGEDAGVSDAGDEDAGHMHPTDAGDDDAGSSDAGEEDAGHMHPTDAGDDAGTTSDAGTNDAGANDSGVTDAGTDAGHMHPGDAGSDAGFVDAGPPIPQIPYEAMAAMVTQSTQHVATLPRPARITVPPRTNCPHLRSGLTAWNPMWSVNGGDVTIPVGASVILRGNSDFPTTTRLRTLTIPVGSELIVDDVPATYTFTDVRVLGAFRLGSPTCRLDSAISFVFDTDEAVGDAGVRAAIAAREGLGLVVDGEFEAFGKLYQPTWTRLGSTTLPNSTSITVQDAVDWQLGQQFVIVSTGRRDYPFEDQNDVRTVTTVMGNTINFWPAINTQHYGGGEYQAEVALLSRSIEFHTAPSVLMNAPTFGGHVLIHGQARVSGLELKGLGQQNFVGRYPFHI
ncbi:MAG: hypothetical protein JNM17_38900, partial [Archangium sp.]|nr:hypothetical protein [Archangium sp.]